MTQLNLDNTALNDLQGANATSALDAGTASVTDDHDPLELATLQSHVDDSFARASNLEVAVRTVTDSGELSGQVTAELADIEQQLGPITQDLETAAGVLDSATGDTSTLTLAAAQDLATTANRGLVQLQHQFDSLTQNPADGVVDQLNGLADNGSDTGVRIASTQIAQNTGGVERYQLQGPSGNYDVTDSNVTVTDGDAHYSTRVVTVTRQTSPSDAPFISAESLGSELGAAVGWLESGDLRNNLPPKTVQWVQNEATGETAIQFWRGNDSAGELDQLAIREPYGWTVVPRDVLNYVPQDKVLDVVDPQGTAFTRGIDNDGKYFWEASYDNASDQRVTLTFTPDQRLALVQTEVAPGQVVYDHKEAFDDLNITTNNIESFPGGRVEYGADRAVAINSAGDVRVNYVEVSEGQFERVSTVQMVYQDGEPTAYRVFQDDATGTATLSRLLNSDGALSDVAPITANPDGSLSFVTSERTQDLGQGTLRLPSGASLRAVADHQEPDPSLPVYAGQSTGNQGSQANGVVTQWSAPSSYAYTNKTTVEEKAGYADGEGEFSNYTIEVDGQLYQYELLPYKNNVGVFADRSGVEYYANTRTEADGTEVQVIGNIQAQSAVTAGILTTEIPEGAFFVPAQGMQANDYMAQLAEQGLEPLAVLGTGFIDAGNENAGIGYHYFNADRLTNPDAPADAGTVYDSAFYEKIRAGYMVDREGNMTLLDYSDMSNAEIRQELATLQENPDVVAINIFSHDAAQNPEDLVGVLQATTEQSSVGKARSYMVFNEAGEFVGHSISPAMSLLDSVTLAQQTFGDDAAYVLNMDGDFYAQNWYADGRDGSSELARRYDNAMILVRPTADGGPAPYQTEDAATREAQDEAYRNAEDDWFKDAVDALREWLF